MPRATDYLLIDISNSFTKLAFASTRRIQGPLRVATARLTSAYLRRLIARRPVNRLVVSSVVPARNREIKRAAGGIRIVWLNARSHLGVGIDYPAPATIGADRLANAAAVAVLYGVPAIVVDFGTAVTFDIVAADKRYIGGVIAPGLESMTNFLYQRTALLPKLSLQEPRRAVGKSTIEAMRVGAIYGYRGLVAEIIERIKGQEFGRRRVRVVATGGYARLIARKLPAIEAVAPNLTLEGLRIVGNLNP
jgi:type III pantothenate kinase